MADRVVKYSFTGNFSNLTAGLTAAGRATQDFGTKLTALDRNGAKTRAGLDHVGRVGGRVALGIGAGLGAMAKAAIDWESAWAGVTKTVDGSAEELAELEAGLRNLARTMPATHAEIAAVAEAAGQLGVAREDILDFTETMLQLAETTNLTADEAATSIAQLTNVMGTAPGDIDNLGAALVALGNDGASTERDIIQMAQRISAAGAQIGLAESDVLALANAAASMGIEVEAGGSAISRIFTSMAKATKQGGEDLESFAQVAGMSAEQFTAAFGEDPAQAFAAFTAGLDAINASGGDVFTMLENLGLSDIRVQNALLSMASSGDLLNESLATGAEAWTENAALTDEYAKRLDTTGSEVRIAWNNIKDAGIETGEALLPVVANLAEGVASMASAFSDLPGPVRNAATGLAGIVAITGGGLWFTSKVVNGVADTKKALQDLGIEAGRVKGALKGLGAGAVAFATLETLGAVVSSLEKKFEDALPSTEALTRAILDLGNAETARRLSEDIGDLGDAVDRLNAGGLQGFADGLSEVANSGGLAGNALKGLSALGVGIGGNLQAQEELREFAAAIEAVDEALANIAITGSAEQAVAAFSALAVEQALTADQQEQLLALLPRYNDALDGAANSATLAESATSGFAAASEDSADANRSEASEINKATQAMRDKRAEANSAFDAETRWGQAVRNAAEQVKTGEKGINRFTEAGQNNRATLSELAAAWNGQEKAVKNSQDRYDSARKTFIDTARDMGVPKKAANELADSLLEIPRKTVAEVEQKGAEKAKGDVDQLKTSLDALRDRTITVTTRFRNLGAQGVGPGRTDETPERRAPRTSGRTTLDRLGSIDVVGRSADLGVRDAMIGLREETAKAGNGLKDLRQKLAQAEKAVDRERRQRDALVARRDNVRSAIQGDLTNDLFAVSQASGNVWSADATPGGVMDPLAAAQERKARAARFVAALRTLKRRGLSGAALEAIISEGLEATEFMAAQSSEYLAAFASELAQANKLIAEAGNLGAKGVVSDAQLDKANAELKAQTQHLKQLEKRLDKIEKHTRNAPERTGREVGREINGSMRNAHRRGKAYQ